jgi:hypothetical protein
MRMTGSVALSLFCLLAPSAETVEITAEPLHHLVGQLWAEAEETQLPAAPPSRAGRGLETPSVSSRR